MRNKDYELIASVIKEETPTPCGYDSNWDEQDYAADRIQGIADILASRFAEIDPKFNREKFLKDCSPYKKD